jgi:hypothetical protein
MEGFKRVIPNSLEDAIQLLQEDKVLVDIKTVPFELKRDIIKFALGYQELKDPLMIMNLINLVKVYNTLEEEYFQNADIYVNSVEELLDLKLALNAELKAFTKQISIYFLSLFKSYSKTAFTATDEHIKLNYLYHAVFCSTDFLTLAGIFAKTPEFSTKDLIYIDDAYKYVSLLIAKGADTILLINDMFEKFKEQE